MPQKTLQERAKQAKRRGEKIPVKQSDVADTGLISTHAAKKVGRLVGHVEPSDRRASSKAPPGRGKRKTAPPAVAAYRRKPRSTKTGGADVGAAGLAKGRTTQSVQGRKKAPSQMNVKRKGGPFKRSRIHGG